jgi:hypothetical protein
MEEKHMIVFGVLLYLPVRGLEIDDPVVRHPVGAEEGVVVEQAAEAQAGELDYCAGLLHLGEQSLVGR